MSDKLKFQEFGRFKSLRHNIELMKVQQKAILENYPDFKESDQPLSEGDWAKSVDGEFVVLITSLIGRGEDTFTGFDSKMEVDERARDDWTKDRFLRHTLEEADLPDGCKYTTTEDGDHMVKWLRNNRWYRICCKSEHDAVSAYREYHMGTKLLQKAGV